MTQRQKMLKALNENVIPKLCQKGFSGSFPHYRRAVDNRIELLAFITEKNGGAFNIEVSAVFSSCDKEMSNYITQDFETIDMVNVFSTNNRFRLKGKINGWFYYTDVYVSKVRMNLLQSFDFYESVGEKKSKTYIPQSSQKLIQKMDDSMYLKICDAVNLQMIDAYIWWDKFNTPEKMKKFR
jgi:hypothetical protein